MITLDEMIRRHGRTTGRRVWKLQSRLRPGLEVRRFEVPGKPFTVKATQEVVETHQLYWGIFRGEQRLTPQMTSLKGTIKRAVRDGLVVE